MISNIRSLTDGVCLTAHLNKNTQIESQLPGAYDRVLRDFLWVYDVDQEIQLSSHYKHFATSKGE